MNIVEALNFLDVDNDEITFEGIRAAHNLAIQKYHPARNAAGMHLCRTANESYRTIGSAIHDGKSIERRKKSRDYGRAMSEALNAVLRLQGVNVRVSGCRIYARDNSNTNSQKLAEAGFSRRTKGKEWFYRPEDAGELMA